MKKNSFFRFGFAVASFALTSHAELLVYDGIPTADTPGTGTAYSAGDIRNATAQNPTHSTIVGATGGWSSSSNTGTIKAGTTTNLVYPASVNLTSLGGALYMTHAENTSVATPYRAVARTIANASDTLSRKSFFATVLMAYDNLAAYPAGAFGGWGLSRTMPTSTSYPLSDGVVMGFRKDAESAETGVSAVLRVAGAYHVIRRNVKPDTHHFFAMRLQYSDIGAEIVSAALLADGAEPLLFENEWNVTVTNEVLSATQTLSWVSTGFYYPINSKNIYVDEWRVGTEWQDVAGDMPGISCIINTGAVSGDRASVTGAVTKVGDSGTTVRVYYGREDGMDNPLAWEDWHEFADPATEDGQVFSVEPDNLVVATNYFFRFAVSTPAGETFAPWTDTFFSSDNIPVVFLVPNATDATKSGVTINGSMTTGFPAVDITACLDTVDRGTDSLPADWAKNADAGSYEFSGSFSATFSGLTANTEYVARFYGTNINGGVWSDTVTFATLPPALTAVDQYIKEGDKGEISVVSIPVSLDVASSQPVAFRHYTSQATDARCENAVPGVHYVDESATVVIPPGITQTNITVHVIGNNEDDFPGKRFWVRFDSVEGATLALSPSPVEVGILDDDLGRRIFFDDFDRGNASGWTLTHAGSWYVSGGRLTWNGGTGSGTAIIGDDAWTEYGFRVMHRTSGSWQGWSIYAYDTTASGGGKYRFWMQNGDYNAQGWSGRLLTNSVYVAGIEGTAVMSGSRVGYGSVLRPLSMRISKTQEGHNRVRCWAGFYKAADWIDTSGDFAGGRIGLEAGMYTPLAFDDVEVFIDRPKRTLILVR